MKLPTVTKKDRLQYPYHTYQAVAGIKLITSLTDKQIADVLENGRGSKTFKAILSAMGSSTNPKWIANRVAESAYNRRLIDERMLDMIMGG